MTRSPDFQCERGQRQEARILAALATGPMTSKQLAATLYLSRDGIRKYTTRLRAEPRRIHIADFLRKTAGKGREAPIFALGDAPDVEFVPNKPAARKLKENPRADQVQRNLDRIIELLTHPMTTDQLAKLLHLSAPRTNFYLRTLRKQKRVRIARYDPPPERGDQSPVYGLGNKPDAVKRRQTRQERMRVEKKNADQYDRSLAKRRASHSVKRALATPQSIFSALGL